MKKGFFLLLLTLSLVSCYNINESVVTKPDPLLSQEKMVSIITDIQLIEAGFTINENRKTERELKPVYYQKVLDNNNITLSQFRDNMIYYQASPKIMENIYENVLANLIKIQNDVQFDIKEMERITDSLSKISDSVALTPQPDTIKTKQIKKDS